VLADISPPQQRAGLRADRCGLRFGCISVRALAGIGGNRHSLAVASSPWSVAILNLGGGEGAAEPCRRAAPACPAASGTSARLVAAPARCSATPGARHVRPSISVPGSAASTPWLVLYSKTGLRLGRASRHRPFCSGVVATWSRAPDRAVRCSASAKGAIHTLVGLGLVITAAWLVPLRHPAKRQRWCSSPWDPGRQHAWSTPCLRSLCRAASMAPARGLPSAASRVSAEPGSSIGPAWRSGL